MKARLFAERVTSATAEAELEDVRAWAVERGDTAAALVLLFALRSRLAPAGDLPVGWRRIGVQRSERQAGLLRTALTIESLLETDPTLGEVLISLVRRFVILAHEAAAYSKLPDFTFRFRHESGRLRFFPETPG